MELTQFSNESVCWQYDQPRILNIDESDHLKVCWMVFINTL